MDSRLFQVADVQEDIRPTPVGLDKTKATLSIPPCKRADLQVPPLNSLASVRSRIRRMVLRHCFDAAHLPLQGTPPEAPFHLPDPVRPSSCPFA